MYNFDLLKGEEVVEIFENIWIKRGKNEKNTTIALTNKRILFLEYDNNDPNEVLRISRGLSYQRYKEVYYQVELSNIKKIFEKENYCVVINNDILFEFSDESLFSLLKK